MIVKQKSLWSDLNKCLADDNLAKSEISNYLTLIYQAIVRDVKSINSMLKQLIISGLTFLALSEGFTNKVSVLGTTITYNEFYSCLFLIFYSYLLSDIIRLLLHVHELKFMHKTLIKKSNQIIDIHNFDEKLISPEAGRYEEVNFTLFGRNNIATGLFFGLCYLGIIVFFITLFKDVLNYSPTYKIQTNLYIKYFSLALATLMIVGTFINIFNHNRLIKKRAN